MKNNNKHINNTYYDENVKVTVYDYIEPLPHERTFRRK